MNDDILIQRMFRLMPSFLGKIIFQKKLFFLLMFFVGSCIGILIGYTSKPKYAATVTFFCEGEKSGGLGAYAGIASQFGIDLGGASSNIFTEENITSLFKSNLLVEKSLLTVSKETNELLIDKYLKTHAVENIKIDGKNFSLSVGFAKIPLQRIKDSLVKSISKSIIDDQLFVDKMNRSIGLITLTYNDHDEVLAKEMAEALVENTTNYYTAYKTKKNLSNVNILQYQVDSVRKMLYGGISEVAMLNDLNVNPLKQKARTETQKSQSQLQVNSVLYTELLKNLELSKISMRKETPLIQIIDSPKLPLKNEKKGKLFLGFIGGFSLFFITVIISFSLFVIRSYK